MSKYRELLNELAKGLNRDRLRVIGKLGLQDPETGEQALDILSQYDDIEATKIITAIACKYPAVTLKGLRILDQRDQVKEFIIQIQKAQPQFTSQAMESMAKYKDVDAINWISHQCKGNAQLAVHALNLLATYTYAGKISRFLYGVEISNEEQCAEDATADIGWIALLHPVVDQALQILSTRHDRRVASAIYYIGDKKPEYAERVFELLKQRKGHHDRSYIRSMGTNNPLYTERAVEFFLPSSSYASSYHIEQILEPAEPLRKLEIISNLTSNFNDVSKQQQTLAKIADQAATAFTKPAALVACFEEGRLERLKDALNKASSLSPQLQETRDKIMAVEKTYILDTNLSP